MINSNFQVIKNKIFTSIIIAVTSLFLVEIVSVLLVYFLFGQFVMFENSSSKNMILVEEEYTDTRQKLSPYFGYSLRPGWKASTTMSVDEFMQSTFENSNTVPWYWELPANNYGFQSPYDYPYKDDDSEAFYIIILGGSVANSFALYSRDIILKSINEVPGYEFRKPVIINLASGGFKQPQQLLALSYFLSIGQTTDLIINMDGLNEAYIGWSNDKLYGTDASLPYSVFLYGLLNNFYSVNANDRIGELKKSKELFRYFLNTTNISTLYLVSKVFLDNFESKIAELENEISSEVTGRTYPMTIQDADSTNIDELVRNITETWINSSIAIQGIAEKYNIPYIHTIQPNQYLGNKIMFEKEKKAAFSNPPWHGIDIVRLVYKKMINSKQILINEGVNFLDLTNVFDDYSEPLYFDACCHFNSKGYQIIMDDILKQAIRTSLIGHVEK